MWNQYKKILTNQWISITNYAKYKDLGELVTNQSVQPPQRREEYITGPQNNNSQGSGELKKSILFEISSAENKYKFINNNKVCVVYIWGSWCGPCQQLIKSGRYERLAEKYNTPGVCMLAKEDVDLKISQDVKGIPLFQFFKDGEYAGHVIGANLQEVEDKIKLLFQN